VRPIKLLQRGAYLVNTMAACGRCHTPRDAHGNPIAAMDLAGGFEFDDGVIGHVVGPNITPGRETGIGKWSEGQIIVALRYATRPDGTLIGAPMPIAAYRDISDSDLTAIAKYLRSLRPIRHPVGRTHTKRHRPRRIRRQSMSRRRRRRTNSPTAPIWPGRLGTAMTAIRSSGQTGVRSTAAGSTRADGGLTGF
jgi:mono/diheme cytochrome c family protein